MPESDTVTVAVVAAAASIGAGILSWIEAARAASIAAKSQLEVERIRSQEAHRLELLRMSESKWQQTSRALAEAWAAIQIFRDNIGKFLGPGAYDTDVFHDRLAAQAEAISTGYAQNGASLDDAPRQAWHRAKNVSDATCTHVANLIAHSSDPKTPDTVHALQDARNALADCQAVIASAERRVMLALIGNFFEKPL